MTESQSFTHWSDPAVLVNSVRLFGRANDQIWRWRRECPTWRLAGESRWHLNELQLGRIILDLWQATP